MLEERLTHVERIEQWARELWMHTYTTPVRIDSPDADIYQEVLDEAIRHPNEYNEARALVENMVFQCAPGLVWTQPAVDPPPTPFREQPVEPVYADLFVGHSVQWFVVKDEAGDADMGNRQPLPADEGHKIAKALTLLLCRETTFKDPAFGRVPLGSRHFFGHRCGRCRSMGVNIITYRPHKDRFYFTCGECMKPMMELWWDNYGQRWTL